MEGEVLEDVVSLVVESVALCVGVGGVSYELLLVPVLKQAHQCLVGLVKKGEVFGNGAVIPDAALGFGALQARHPMNHSVDEMGADDVEAVIVQDLLGFGGRLKEGSGRPSVIVELAGEDGYEHGGLRKTGAKLPICR